jgi:hypothetical protein
LFKTRFFDILFKLFFGHFNACLHRLRSRFGRARPAKAGSFRTPR